MLHPDPAGLQRLANHTPWALPNKHRFQVAGLAVAESHLIPASLCFCLCAFLFLTPSSIARVDCGSQCKTGHRQRGRKAQQSWGSKLHWVQSGPTKKRISTLSLLLYIQHYTPDHGKMSGMLKVGLPSSVKPLWKYTHRQVPKHVYSITPNPVTLTMKNHRWPLV